MSNFVNLNGSAMCSAATLPGPVLLGRTFFSDAKQFRPRLEQTGKDEPRTLSPTPVHEPIFFAEPRTLPPTPQHMPISPDLHTLTDDLLARLGGPSWTRDADWSIRKAQSCTSTEALTPLSDSLLDADSAFIENSEEELEVQLAPDDEYEVEVEPDEVHEVEVEPDDVYEIEVEPDNEYTRHIDDFTCMPQGLFEQLLASGARARKRNQHMFIRHAKSSKLDELVQFDLCVVG